MAGETPFPPPPPTTKKRYALAKGVVRKNIYEYVSLLNVLGNRQSEVIHFQNYYFWKVKAKKAKS